MTLNLSLLGEDRKGRFSAPTFVVSSDRALESNETPPLCFWVVLNNLELPSRNKVLGEGMGDETSMGVGLRAKM